jgi:Flp pilus assembly pilin Flp
VKQDLWSDVISRFRILIAGMASSEDGQTLVEYALIVALVSVALIAALTVVTGNIQAVFNAVDTALQAV